MALSWLFRCVVVEFLRGHLILSIFRLKRAIRSRMLSRISGFSVNDWESTPQRIVTPHQVHGDEVVIVDDIPNRPPEADAIITTAPGIYPAVKTADCVPILLIDPVRRISAAVHVGWRGAVLRIARKVLRLLKINLRAIPRT